MNKRCFIHPCICSIQNSKFLIINKVLFYSGFRGNSLAFSYNRKWASNPCFSPCSPLSHFISIFNLWSQLGLHTVSSPHYSRLWQFWPRSLFLITAEYLSTYSFQSPDPDFPSMQSPIFFILLHIKYFITWNECSWNGKEGKIPKKKTGSSIFTRSVAKTEPPHRNGTFKNTA